MRGCLDRKAKGSVLLAFNLSFVLRKSITFMNSNPNPLFAKRSLLTAIGIGCALAGLGISWWKEKSRQEAVLSLEASNALWQAQLEASSSETVSLSDFKGH